MSSVNLTVRYGSMLQIPASMVSSDVVFKALAAQCVVRNTRYALAEREGASEEELEKIPRTIKMWHHDDEYMYVPRHVSLDLLGPRHFIRKIDFLRRLRDRADPIPTNIQLRDSIQEEAYAHLMEPGDKSISLACGRGKTVIALKAACDRGFAKILIVVPTTALAQQWVDDGILGFTNDTKTVPFIPGVERADIGMLGDGKRKIGERFTLGIINTIAIGKNIDSLRDTFDLVIFDEIHRYGTEKFHQAASKFNAERLGMSATVTRADRMDTLFRMHVGETVYTNLEQDLVSKVLVASTPYGMDRNGKDCPTVHDTIVGRGYLHSMLLRDCGRTDLIVDMVVAAHETGRNLLVLTNRKAFILEAQQMLLRKGIPEADVGLIYRAKGVKKGDLKTAKLRRIVIAIDSMVKEGFDRKDKDLWGDFDMIVMTTPQYGENTFNQIRGRIERTFSGKWSPIVVVFADSHTLIRAHVLKLRKVAYKHNITVEFMDDPDQDFRHYLTLQTRAEVCLQHAHTSTTDG